MQYFSVPYEGEHFNTGRETFMTPVEWKDGWPHILEGHEEVQYQYPVPFPAQTKKLSNNFNGNFFFKDDFKAAQLNYRWEFLRTPEEKWYSLTEQKGSLSVNLLPQTCTGKANPAFLGFRQSHLIGYAATAMDFAARSANEKAGLLIFQNETHFYFVCKSIENNAQVVQLYKSGPTDEKMELLQSQALTGSGKELSLKIETKGNTIAFYFAVQKGKWNLLKDGVDAKFLSTQTAGGFVGNMYALYATSSGEKVNNKAYFNSFENKNNDLLYK